MQSKWTEARDYLSRALKIEPANAEAHNSMGSFYIYTGNLELAAQEFGEAIRLSPRFAGARYNLGLVLVKQGNVRGAATQAPRSCDSGPQAVGGESTLDRLEAK